MKCSICGAMDPTAVRDGSFGDISVGREKMKVGDHVRWGGDEFISDEFIIEKDYGQGVFKIGNDAYFIDLIHESELEKIDANFSQGE